MKQSVEVPSKKKPYLPPKLLIYGNLAQMTQGKGLVGQPDGAKTGRNRRTG